MPVRNAGEHLAEAVDSILHQQGVEFELVIVDDHSNDGAITTVAAARNPKISLHRNRGRGLVAALNTAIENSNGEFIARMDADDIAHPQRLVVQLKYLQENPDIDICGCMVEMFADDDLGAGYRLYEDWINTLQTHADIEREFFIESPIAHPSALLRRSAMDRLQGYQDNDWPEDYDLWSRALLLGLRFGKPSGAPLLRWRDYQQRTSRTQKQYSKAAFMACKAHFLNQYLSAKQFESCAIWGTGPTGLKLYDGLVKNGRIIEEFIDVDANMIGRQKRQKPVQVVDPMNNDAARQMLAKYLQRKRLILVAVSARGARAKIRSFLTSAGLTESSDFLCVA